MLLTGIEPVTSSDATTKKHESGGSLSIQSGLRDKHVTSSFNTNVNGILLDNDENEGNKFICSLVMKAKDNVLGKNKKMTITTMIKTKGQNQKGTAEFFIFLYRAFLSQL